MTAQDAAAWSSRFPGFDVTAQRRHWDPITASVVDARCAAPTTHRFFTPSQVETACALCSRLLATDRPEMIVAAIDSRLADDATDGWHHEQMPPDEGAWPASLAALDEDALASRGARFAHCPPDAQAELIDSVRDRRDGTWHGLPASWVWSLWMRYSCTAFYAHPTAWNEIGFAGPAYPRGYKNATVGGREPFEVADHGLSGGTP